MTRVPLLPAGLLALLLAAQPALAADAAKEEALEARAVALETELRCLVCQNQTLADSHAPLAVDLRRQIREQMEKGASDRDVIDYMVARYGDFVLYRPPLKATTLLLWAGPLLLLLAGFAALVYRLRRRPAPAPGLSPGDKARAAALLGGPEER